MQREVTFYVDGACSGNHRRDLTGWMGAGIVGISGKMRREWSVPLGAGTNQKAEILAVKEALRRVSDRARTRVRIVTDSQYAVKVLSGQWNAKANLEEVAAARALIRELAGFTIEWTRGHAGDPANEQADRLAVRACQIAMAEGTQPTFRDE
jgi:ribonuclease HI